jgi:hypothetical protein
LVKVGWSEFATSINVGIRPSFRSLPPSSCIWVLSKHQCATQTMKVVSHRPPREHLTLPMLNFSEHSWTFPVNTS